MNAERIAADDLATISRICGEPGVGVNTSLLGGMCWHWINRCIAAEAKAAAADAISRAEGMAERIESWRAWVATIIGFDHVTTSKTDADMRADVDAEARRLIEQCGFEKTNRETCEAEIDNLNLQIQMMVGLLKAVEPFIPKDFTSEFKISSDGKLVIEAALSGKAGA